GFPCLVHAKGDAEVCGVRPALAASANVSLLTRAEVKRWLTDAAGTPGTARAAEQIFRMQDRWEAGAVYRL
ncbi:MAG: hypothetical protein ACK5PI_03700, partial [Acetobacteraceae bacterium]